MSSYDNYPDDIRQFDNDPRSPFYEEPPLTDEDVRQRVEEMLDDDIPGCETLDLLRECDEHVLALKDLLNQSPEEDDKFLAIMARKLINESQQYLEDWVRDE